MPHAVLLRPEIELVELVGSYLDGDVLDNRKTIRLEADTLHRIVGHQAHLRDTQMAEDLGADTIVALVSLVSETNIRVDRVHAVLLEFVRLHLFHQTDTATFLIEIDDRPATLGLDFPQSLVQLLAAIAAQGAEDVARRAGRMDADQHRLGTADVALDDGNVLQPVALLAERDETEVAELCGHVHLFALLHNRLLLQAVGNQIGDRDEFDVIFVGHLAQFRETRHRTVVVHNFHQGSRRIETRQAREVDAGLRMPCPTQNTLVLGVERVDMSRTAKSFRLRGGVGQREDSRCAVGSRDTRRTTFELVDGYGKGRTEDRSIVAHLVRQVKLFATRHRDRRAEDATGVLQHEVYLLGRYFFGSDDEVALILAVFVIDYDDKLAFREIPDSFFDRIQFDSAHIVEYLCRFCIIAQM